MFFEVHKNLWTGEGLLKTHSYKSKVSKRELLQKRNIFWETRVEGSQQAWGILKALAVKEYDLATAKSLMGAIGLYLVKNTVQLVYDDDQNRYEVPIFCINEPDEYENEADPYTVVDFEQK